MLMLLWAVAARAEPAVDWHERPDAVLVVVIVDGLVGAMLDEADEDGQPLMPRLAGWANGSVRFDDVLARDTNPRESRTWLRDQLESFGAEEVRWVRIDRVNRDDPLGAAEEILAVPGRRVLVLDLDWLEPPLRVDARQLAKLDPAPWDRSGTDHAIEAWAEARLERARRLAATKSRANPARTDLVRDIGWVVRAAHAAIDPQLEELLDSFSDPRVAVVLTATSSAGLGQREAVGPGIGAALDVAQVPVIVRLAGEAPRREPGPRQLIGFSPEWFAGVAEPDRVTWSSPPEGASGKLMVCEARWTTQDFTLLDATMPRRPPRLFDRRLDPGEWLDRGIEYPALADSLKRAFRARLYGATPLVVFRAGLDPVSLSLSSAVALEGPPDRDLVSISLQPGEVLRVRMPQGAASVGWGARLPVTVGGERYLLSELVVHSPAWRAALGEPGPGDEFTVWIE